MNLNSSKLQWTVFLIVVGAVGLLLLNRINEPETVSYGLESYAAEEVPSCSETSVLCVPLEFPTIQACANTAVAGNTCLVSAGFYDEAVVVKNSGTVGSPITFVASPGPRPQVRRFDLTGKSYVTLKGFEITNAGMTVETWIMPSIMANGSTGLKILNNYIHDTAWIVFRCNAGGGAAKCKQVLIQGNTITNVGPANSGAPNYTGGRSAAIQLWGDNSIIERNDISHSADFVQMFGNHNVVRNNTFHDSYISESLGYNGVFGYGDHIDGWQSYCTGTNPAPEAANYTLIEGNIMRDVPDTHSHFALINGTNTCTGTTTTDIIVRNNTVHRVGSSFYVADTNLQGPASFHKIYNNTVVTLPYAADHAAAGTTGVTTGSFINNIFYDAMVDRYNYNGYRLKTGDLTSTGDYNLGFMSSGAKTWASPIGTEQHHVLNQDPQFVSSTDFNLQSTSPAKDAGGPLTMVAGSDSGSGTTLVLNDAHFFQPGWAGVQADWIAVGSTSNAAQIVNIDYSTNTITLASPISRSSGDPVFLFKDSTGRQVLYGSAPDIGAFEFGSSSSPSPTPPPPSPTPINGQCSTPLNTCSSGTFSDITDTSTNYLWSCVGMNGGTTASCSLPVPPTLVTLTISSISVTTAATSATIKWTTNVPSKGSVYYGSTSNNLNQSVSESSYTTTHSITIPNLNKSTRYYYQIRSANQDNTSTANSSVGNFRTKNK